jgi:proline iminopeptidase
MSMNRKQFFQRSAAAALCADGLLPSSLEAQSPAAPLPDGAEAAAVAAINPLAGVRVAGILMIPLVGGKYKVWTKRLGSGKTKVLLLHGGPAMTDGYPEAMESLLPDACIEMYYYHQLGYGNSDIPEDTSL